MVRAEAERGGQIDMITSEITNTANEPLTVLAVVAVIALVVFLFWRVFYHRCVYSLL